MLKTSQKNTKARFNSSNKGKPSTKMARTMRGRIKVMFYDDNRNLTEETTLDPAAGNYGINIPENQWHTLEVLESESVILEVKEGPYSPIAPEDMLGTI